MVGRMPLRVSGIPIAAPPRAGPRTPYAAPASIQRNRTMTIAQHRLTEEEFEAFLLSGIEGY